MITIDTGEDPWAEIERLKRLITELADALVSSEKPFAWYDEDNDLIQRAREAVK